MCAVLLCVRLGTYDIYGRENAITLGMELFSKHSKTLSRSVSFDRSIARLIARSISFSVDRSIIRSIARSTARSLDRSIDRSSAQTIRGSLVSEIPPWLVAPFKPTSFHKS